MSMVTFWSIWWLFDAFDQLNLIKSILFVAILTMCATLFCSWYCSFTSVHLNLIIICNLHALSGVVSLLQVCFPCDFSIALQLWSIYHLRSTNSYSFSIFDASVLFARSRCRPATKFSRLRYTWLLQNLHPAEHLATSSARHLWIIASIPFGASSSILSS